MLYPGVDHKYTSSIFEEHSDDFKKINEFQILDFSICGYMPCSLLVPFFELHFRNYNFSEIHFNDKKIGNWFSKLTHKNEKIFFRFL